MDHSKLINPILFFCFLLVAPRLIAATPEAVQVVQHSTQYQLAFLHGSLLPEQSVKQPKPLFNLAQSIIKSHTTTPVASAQDKPETQLETSNPHEPKTNQVTSGNNEDLPVFLSNRMVLLLTLVVIFPLILIFWHRRNLLATVLAMISFALILEIQIESIIKQENAQQQELDLLRQLSSVTAKLEGNLKTNISLLAGFAAYISATPDLTQSDFSNYAKELLRQEPMLINFASAKNLVVNFVYPIRGNESVLGLDYKKNEAQREMVLRVAELEKPIVIGPVNLVQGGVAFIGRMPIYTGTDENKRFWGIISAPLDADSLYRNSGILALAKDVDLAIRYLKADGQPGATFFGKNEIFLSQDHIISTIDLGADSWQLAIVNRSANKGLLTSIAISRFSMVLATTLLSLLVLIRFRQLNQQKVLESAILSSQQLLEKVGRVAKVGGWHINQDLEFVEWSAQASQLLKLPKNDSPTRFDQVEAFFEKEDFKYWRQQIQRALAENSSFDMELKLRSSDENTTWLRIIGNTSDDEDRIVAGTIQDVTDKVESAKLIEKQATFDSLTNLPNRTLFNDRLAKATQSAHRNDSHVAVLFIDLDRFKPVNDNHGHQTGDKLLIRAAARIQKCVRQSDTVARLSGDEFGVILVNINRYNDALAVIEKIYDNMQTTYEIDDFRLHCSASIGVSFYPGDGESAESLLRKADQAMYEVKSSGRNGWQYYTSQMQQKSEHRHRVLNELMTAVNREQLITYYQPIASLTDNTIMKCEALARWKNSSGKFVSPAEFIPLAEESGLINKIDLMMLKNAAIAVRQFSQGNTPVGLSINVSPRLFHAQDKALETWLECVKECSQLIDITVEITERLIIGDEDIALEVIKKLKSWGVKLAFDDFGTGFSSLSYLIKFPVDIIKIDRSFVDSIGRDSSAETLIQTILIMAKELNLKVIAEGIETQEQLNFLKSYECDFGQGYFLGKPMPSDEFKIKLTNN